jgi:starch phosphorylase
MMMHGEGGRLYVVDASSTQPGRQAATWLSRPLPAALEALVGLSLDLRWTWSHATDHVWAALDPLAWERTANPWLILQTVPQSRLDELAADGAFAGEVARLEAARRDYLVQASWCARNLPDVHDCTVAYFSMEYGLSEALPIYSGGLGVLAGDHLKTASDLGLPVVGIGLMYQQGYFRQVVDTDGRQLELQPQNVPSDLPLEPVLADDGSRLAVSVELPGRKVRLRVWLARVGRVSLYLLDSNHPLNSPSDRGITAQLYVGGAEKRLLQEIVLGIGGWQALRALGIDAHVCHLNEGHAAFVTLERARMFMKRHGVRFDEALWATRPGNVFTTHTPVAAAFDRYPAELLRKYGSAYAASFGVDPETLLGLGRADPADGSEPFNMAFLAARTCGSINGVSALHGVVSRKILQPLFPRWPESDVPVRHVTNGVHVPSWDAAAADALWTRACGPERWREPRDDVAAPIVDLPATEIWAMRGTQRAELIDYSRRRVALQLAQRGADPATVDFAARALDPNTLTLGFARRFTAYKRPHLLLQDPDRLARLLNDDARPVQIIVAGKAHPQDERGKELIRDWIRFVSRADVRPRAVFVEDYDITLAATLVKGIDVWINTPLRPWEASGTSGMKVLVNGGLNLSSLDGWWAEAYEPDVGWALEDGSNHGNPDPPPSHAEVDRLFSILERQIVPEFYDRDPAGIPQRWVERVRASMVKLTPRFSSSRMVLEYVRDSYLPAVQGMKRRSADRACRARELAAWERRLRDDWHEIHVGALSSRSTDDGVVFEVPVYLGRVLPEDVAVELYADGLGPEPPIRAAMTASGPLSGAANGFRYAATLRTARPPAHFTPRVVPCSADALVPLELPLIRWGEPG